MAVPVLRVEGLTVHFQRRFGWRRRTIHAVDDVNLEVGDGETLALVGESGCGKTTMGRAILGLVRATSGSIFYGERDVTDLSKRQWRSLRPYAQIVFQESSATLDPRLTVGDSVAEPLVVHGRLPDRGAREAKVAELLELVGLPRALRTRRPHMLSGGQRQRVGIARALALQPRLLVADEPMSGLDVSVQAQVINLLRQLQADFGLAYVLISHDLGAVRQVAHRVAIMYLGRIVEIGPKIQIYENPLHPYTRALIAAAPALRKERAPHEAIPGEPPSALNPPVGCRFNTRCPLAHAPCFVNVPPLVDHGSGHLVACWALDPPGEGLGVPG